jgi:hypothetical protein
VQTWTRNDTKEADWGPGPWVDEPDKAQWTDERTGLPCVARRNIDGAWCGYVAVNSDHPLWQVGWQDAGLRVEGIYVNYAAHCEEDGPIEDRVCHIPEPGQPDDVWWFGFDLAHAWDYQPFVAAQLREIGLGWFAACNPANYRTFGEVQRRCALLAEQLGCQ